MTSSRVLILAPRGRDAALAADLLRQAGLDCHVCASGDALMAEFDAGAGAVLMTEEALAAGTASTLAAWVAAQPRWSDVPFVVLSNGQRGKRPTAAATRSTRWATSSCSIGRSTPTRWSVRCARR